MSSENLRKKLNHLTTIENWYDKRVGSIGELNIIFNNVFNIDNVFAAIYVAIRQNPQSASATETYNYYNVGFTADDITSYFYIKYSLNYLGYSYNSGDDKANLRYRIATIYKANKYKYMKLIESMGYKYNPLFNVDGIELYSNAEAYGDITNTRTPSGTVVSVSGADNAGTPSEMITSNYVNPYDNNSTSDASQLDSKTVQSPVISKQTFDDNYHETTTAQNEPATNYTYDSATGTWQKSGLFEIAAKDSAFGVAINGPERYYAEKRIRQGNIGVTKSQELLTAERNVVKFNILDELMKDLEREIVVGIY